MGHHEVLAAGLADDPRVRAVAGEVLPDLAPQHLKDPGRAGEVNAGQVTVGQGDLGHLDPLPGDHVNDPGRQAGLQEQVHHHRSRPLLGGGRLPHHRVAHQDRRRR